MFTDLKFKPSGFYLNFSVSEVIKQMVSSAALICAKGSMGGSGTGSGHSNDERAHYRKHDSFSCHIKPEDREGFDEAELMRELKSKVESEISSLGARVTGGDQFTYSSFYLEYADENITGRIEIKGGFQQENYFRIEVSFDETSSSQNQPLIEKPLDDYQPVGAYHVVAFASDSKEARDFYEKGRRATAESNERFRQKYLNEKDNFNDEDYRTVMYVWTRTPAHIKERLKDRFNGFVDLPTEYDGFDKVYFLNDLALQMYREAGEDFKVLKVIPAAEIEKILSRPSFRGYYVPKENNI